MFTATCSSVSVCGTGKHESTSTTPSAPTVPSSVPITRFCPPSRRLKWSTIEKRTCGCTWHDGPSEYKADFDVSPIIAERRGRRRGRSATAESAAT